LRVFAGHEARVLAVAFSPDGTQVASGSSDSTALVWRLEPDDNTSSIRMTLEDAVSSLADPKLERWLEARRVVLQSGEQALPLLIATYPPQSKDPQDRRRYDVLKDRLGDDDPEVRVLAEAKMVALGRRVLPWIHLEIAGRTSAGEALSRLQSVETRLETLPFTVGHLGAVRAILLLTQMMPNATAKRVLQAYAEGPGDLFETELARRALNR
jgi:hypothetical protein